MKKQFFRPMKRQLSFAEYMQETLVTAKRIVEISPGNQRYTSAQFELALVGFGDLKALKNEMDEDIEVNFPPNLQLDLLAGFDWLDLAVSFDDEDAIDYFQQRMKDPVFSKHYQQYKEHCRPDCALQSYEQSKQNQPS